MLRPRVSRVLAGIVLSLLPQLSFAGQAPASGARDARPETGPFVRGVIGVEFGAGGFVDLWTVNEQREWLVDGTGAVWWAFGEGRLWSSST